MDLEHLDTSDFLLFALFPALVFFVLAVHEMGHYIAARIFGLPIEEVSVGVGREIWATKKKKNQTRWSLHLYPIWAHVQIAGFRDSTYPVWQRFITVLAGPFTNMALPFFLYLLFFLAVGQPATQPILTGVEVGAAAERAGLKPGDEIIAVDGKPVYRYIDIRRRGYDPDRESIYTVKRDGETLDLYVRAESLAFTDVDGIERDYPRLGVKWQQKPVGLEIIHSINGINTKDQVPKLRELIQHNFGQVVTLGLHSTDNLIHVYRVRLHPESNPNINDPKHEDYKFLYLGQQRDDFFLRQNFVQNFAEAGVMAGELIRKVASLPFQLLPIDPEVLLPEFYTYQDETWILNKLYMLIHFTALTSLLIAFINLLPLPRLDGSLLLFYVIEGASGKTLTGRQKALALSIFFFIFYWAVVLSNLDNVPHYIDSRVKKLQEFMSKEE